MSYGAGLHRIEPPRTPAVADLPTWESPAGITFINRGELRCLSRNRSRLSHQQFTYPQEQAISLSERRESLRIKAPPQHQITKSADEDRKPPVQPGVVTHLWRRPVNEFMQLFTDVDTAAKRIFEGSVEKLPSFIDKT